MHLIHFMYMSLSGKGAGIFLFHPREFFLRNIEQALCF
jgi:hypothetical protein